MKITLNKKFAQRINAKFARFEFSVGILENKQHRPAASKKAGQGMLAGGPIRKTARRSSTTSVADVSGYVRKSQNFDYLRDPFRKPMEGDQKNLRKFVGAFIRMALAKEQPRRVENLLQAVVRNPLARSDYGSNSLKTIMRKGFDRLLMDTGQLFKAVRARVKQSSRGLR